MQHAETIANLITERNYHWIVEVGVLAGYFARDVLQACPSVVLYWGVDPWRPYAGHPWMTEEKFDEVATSVYAFSLMEPRFRVLRLPSVWGAALFSDASLDLVFLDGDHGEEAVAADGHAWLPKVRPGGMLTGHDYDPVRPAIPNWGVRQGIERVVPQGYIRSLPGTVWQVVKDDQGKLIPCEVGR